MYEEFYGFAEKPFSLTPDPKYLYRSQSHANAFDLLQYAIHRREGFVVITGDIGTGKTTLCRALLEQVDRTTFTALVLNPFLSEEDLLKRILVDFGVISREELKTGRLTHVTKQELVDALSDFLLGLIPLKASAVLIIDEAQNLPTPVLEQIRILSNLETAKEKLLQIILVGQLELQGLLRSPGMRQLDQRVSIRYELKPLDEETVSAYVAHRLTIAGGSASVAFTAKALRQVHRLSAGIPRLINLICDRALLAGFAERASRITPDMVTHAAASLDVRPPRRARFARLRARAALIATTTIVVLASALAVVGTAVVYQQFDVATVHASAAPAGPAVARPAIAVPAAARPVEADRVLPTEAALTILAGSYAWPAPSDAPAPWDEATAWLESAGFHVYYADVDLGRRGRWRRVLAGAYAPAEAGAARADALRIAAGPVAGGARVVAAASVAVAAATSARAATAGRPEGEP